MGYTMTIEFMLKMRKIKITNKSKVFYEQRMMKVRKLYKTIRRDKTS